MKQFKLFTLFLAIMLMAAPAFAQIIAIPVGPTVPAFAQIIAIPVGPTVSMSMLADESDLFSIAIGTGSVSVEGTDIRLGVSETTVTTVTISNNNRAGFSITPSATTGKLKHSAASDCTNSGDCATYVIDLNFNGDGTLGDAITASANSYDGHNLSAASYSQVTEATVGAVFNVNLTVAQDTGVFEGTYSDTLTFVMADL